MKFHIVDRDGLVETIEGQWADVTDSNLSIHRGRGPVALFAPGEWRRMYMDDVFGTEIHAEPAIPGEPGPGSKANSENTPLPP